MSAQISHILVFHKKSRQLIYYQTAPPEEFDPHFLSRIQTLVHREEVQVALEGGKFLEYPLESAHLLLRSGRLCAVILALNSSPSPSIRRALELFGNRLDSEWADELTFLYSKYKGEMRIFSRPRPPKTPIAGLIDESFHLRYSLPHRMNSTPDPMTEVQANIWYYGQKMAAESGHIVLGEYLSKVVTEYPDYRHEAPKTLLDFIARSHITPIPLKRSVHVSEK